MKGSNLITNSRLRCLRECPRRHYYRHEVGLQSTEERAALRFGTMYHAGLDMLANGLDTNEVCRLVRENYAATPDLAVECETVMRLLLGWAWRWGEDGLVTHASERIFNLPLINPETGCATQSFRRAGKIDRLSRLADGRMALHEFKTTSDSVAPDSDYWQILRMDSQVSFYFDAVPEAETILYDVTRKPAISPKQVPILDEFGLKIVLDVSGQRVFKKGGLPRETGDAEKGYVLQVRIETAQEFGDRLTADIGERPDFYYARREVPRLTGDIESFRAELWQDQQMLRWRQKHCCWPRHPGRNCNYCEFKRICFADIYPIGDVTPDGFIRIENIHPELQEATNVRTTESAAGTAAGSETI